MKYLITFSIFLLFGCSQDTETGQLTPVASGDFKVGNHLASQDALNTFKSYLDSRHIPYEIMPEEPFVVWWRPYNKEHDELIVREAFGIPPNQVQKIFESKNQADELLDVLTRLSVEHSKGPIDDGYLVLYFPVSDEQRHNIESILKQ
ncbi:hypothetical protein GV054_11815 [Marinomonas mediterranea]|uniref:hypothetical protein n=1 Tax=Marinomonas mediterranea TaxID=119864 RepID=UPI002349C7F7|nr:hypothetical protein [Marinomonas mediterranea]WCN13638.1 hypothetical protein GV054_11815 [Marinomonas mediterranea]